MGVKVRFHRNAWWIFIAHRGRRRSKKVGDRATALQVARRVRERLQFGDLTLLGTDTETFEKYATRWLTDGEKGRKASTHRFYNFNLTLHILPTLGSHPVGSITRADCRKVLTTCRAKGLKVASSRVSGRISGRTSSPWRTCRPIRNAGLAGRMPSSTACVRTALSVR